MTSTTNPQVFPTANGRGIDHPGMTMRDYFAARFAQTLLEKTTVEDWVKHGSRIRTEVASTAYSLADAMLAERDKEAKP